MRPQEFATVIKDFNKVRSKCKTVCKYLENELRLGVTTIAPHAIVQSRSKSVLSFAEKILEKGNKYEDPFKEITDLSGVRIIVHTLAEVEKVAELILVHKSFQIVKEDSHDAAQALNPKEFGYRGVHFVVRFKECDSAGSKLEGAPPLAEIQIRTIAQHCWAAIGHDSVYKSRVPISARRQREFTLIAALLEDVDQAIVRAVGGISSIRGSGEHFLGERELKAESKRLSQISKLQSLKHDEHLAFRRARVALRRGDWTGVCEICDKAKESGDLSLCMAIAKWQLSETDGARGLFQKSVDLNPNKLLARLYLGHFERSCGEEEAALKAYTDAYEMSGSDPAALSAYVIEHAYSQRKIEFTALHINTVSLAINTCEEQANMGIDVPGVLFTLGELHLLLSVSSDDNDEKSHFRASLRSYTKGLTFAPGRIELRLANEASQRIQKVSAAGKASWIVSLIEVYKAHCFDCSFPDLVDVEQSGWDGSANIVLMPIEANDESLGAFITENKERFVDAFKKFSGTVVPNGGSRGVEAALQATKEINAKLKIATFWPSDPNQECCEAYDKIEVIGQKSCSELTEIATWQCILEIGVPARSVRLLAIGGNDLNAFAYRLALAFGAEVGVIEGSGGAADELLHDPFWNTRDNLIVLPRADEELWARFVNGSANVISCLLEDTSNSRSQDAAKGEFQDRENFKVEFVRKELHKLDEATNERIMDRHGGHDVVIQYSYRLPRYVENDLVHTIDELKEMLPHEPFGFEHHLIDDEKRYERWKQSSFYFVGKNKQPEPEASQKLLEVEKWSPEGDIVALRN